MQTTTTSTSSPSSSSSSSSSNTFTIACQQCRNSHWKCDRKLPMCSRCLASGRECAYVEPKKRMRSNNEKTSRITLLKKRRVEEEEQQQTKQVPYQSSDIMNMYYSNPIQPTNIVPQEYVNQACAQNYNETNKEKNETLEFKIDKVVWKSIELVTLQRSLITRNSDDADLVAQILKTIKQKYEVCLNILLDKQVFKQIAFHEKLSWAAINMTIYLLESDPLDQRNYAESLIWIGTVKPLVMNPCVDCKITGCYAILKCLQFEMRNVDRNYAVLMKMIKKIIKLYREMIRLKLFNENANFAIEELKSAIVIIKLKLESNSSNLVELQNLVKSFDNIIKGPEYAPKHMLPFIRGDQITYKMDCMLSEEQLVDNEDPNIRRELFRMKLAIADEITCFFSENTKLPTGSMTYIRTIHNALEVHMQGTKDVSLNIPAIAAKLQRDVQIVETLTIGHKVPVNTLALLSEAKQWLSSSTNTTSFYSELDSLITNSDVDENIVPFGITLDDLLLDDDTIAQILFDTNDHTATSWNE